MSSPIVKQQPLFWEEEPTDEELGWADDDSVPVNFWGEVDEDAQTED